MSQAHLDIHGAGLVKPSRQLAGSFHAAMERLRARGFDVSWYDKALKKPTAKIKRTRPTIDRSKPCGMLNTFHIRYLNGIAKISTIDHDGSPYNLRFEEPTKKTGDPIWWCSSCNKTFKTFSANLKHRTI